MMSVTVVPWNVPRKTPHCQKPHDSRCYFPSCRPGGPWGKAWFHPAKELKANCTINPHKANNLKGFKPLGARIPWSVVGASILAPAGAGISLPSLLPAASWVYGIHSLSLLLSSLQTFTTFSLHPVHPWFHWEPPGSCPVDLGMFSAVGTRIFPKILAVAQWGHTSPAAAAPLTGRVSGTCCFRQWAWITLFFKYGKSRAGHGRTFFLTCKNLILLLF